MSEIEIRTPTEDDLPALTRLDERAFGDPWNDESMALFRPVCDLTRFRIACDGADVVGAAGSYAQELTVPGGHQVRAGGVTWVSVVPTHRRRGLLRRLMVTTHDDIAARGEPLALLTASEGGIYERFGYGVATRCRLIEIDRRRTQVSPRFVPPGPPDGAPLRVVDPNDHIDQLVETFDRFRRLRVGEIDRSAAWERLRLHEFGKKTTAALHPDGFAVWAVNSNWNDGHPEFELRLQDLVAVTPEAHAALWNLILSIDLVGPIRSRQSMSLDDPLPFLLDDQRALRTTDLNDMLWVRPGDVRAAFAARTYGTDDSFVVEVTTGDDRQRWKISGSPDGADVRKVRSKPHLSTDQASLGALFLGGVLPSTLAAGRRLTASSTDALRRADHFFGHDPLAHCSTGF
jgi:predicted acetyltransferase